MVSNEYVRPKRKLFYRVKTRIYTGNPILNILVHTVLEIMRGMANIIDGLVLIISLGQIYTALGFKSVMFMIKKQK
tara:strand:+ start:43 stop:270 length:228 start_codon:yes stop_codon:yes gene_type:complete